LALDPLLDAIVLGVVHGAEQYPTAVESQRIRRI